MAGDGNGLAGARSPRRAPGAEEGRSGAAFKATYGPKHAIATHQGGAGRDVRDYPTEFKNAAKECRAERDEDPELFQETYGTNGNKRNAFGKCVSGKVKADPVRGARGSDSPL